MQTRSEVCLRALIRGHLLSRYAEHPEEANGVLVSRVVGRTRLFTFNERNPTVRNLRQFLTVELDRGCVSF